MFIFMREQLLKKKSFDGFIIKSRPRRVDIDDDEFDSLINHIECGISDGLTEHEIMLLLNWTVENTRRNIEKFIGKDIIDEPLHGLCGFAQCSSLSPLEKIRGIKVKYVNIGDIKYVSPEFRHAFGIVQIPFRQDDIKQYREYLIDVTLRQFYTTGMCIRRNRKMLETGYQMYTVDPGFFTCVNGTKHDKMIIAELLENGYIELTSEILKLYVDSFIYSSIMKYSPQLEKQVRKLDNEWYANQTNQIIYERDYYDVDLRSLGYNTKLKSLKK